MIFKLFLKRARVRQTREKRSKPQGLQEELQQVDQLSRVQQHNRERVASRAPGREPIKRGKPHRLRSIL